MQRYFVSKIDKDIFTLSESDSYHITTVMRMSLKDKIEIVYDSNEYLCEIISLDGNVKCRILEKFEKKEQHMPRVVIAQALVKEQKMDYILQKSTELGVSEIIPLEMERSVVKIDKKEEKKLERWRKVLKEASEQSKRINVPTLHSVISLNDLIKGNFDFKFICSVNERSKTIKSVLSKVNIDDTILFVIGPEGGLSKKEETLLLNNGFESVTFGDFVLRTETASLFVLSTINYEFMR